MTTWRWSWSWSKVKAALTCQLQLQYACDKRPVADFRPSYWRELGIWGQYVWELYFNQRINLNPKARSEAAISRAVDKILASPKFNAAHITYPPGKGPADFEADLRAQVLGGFRHLKKLGTLPRRTDSEKKWNATFRSLRLFAMMDFISYAKDCVDIADGKGHREMNADPRQLVFYALTLHASGNPVRNAHLIYWNHEDGIVPVDVSPRALKEFVDGDLERVRPILQELQSGINRELPANPSAENCGNCNWRNTCPASYFAKEAVEVHDVGLVDFT